MHRLAMGLFACTLLLALNINAQAVTKKIRLVTGHWQPYMNAKDTYHGYVYEIVKSAFNAVNIDVEIAFLPWGQAFTAVEKGVASGVFPLYQTEARRQQFQFSTPFSSGPLVMYTRSNETIKIPATTTYQGNIFQAMRQYRFGVVKGYANTPAFDKAQNIKKSEVVNDKDNIIQLVNGDVDIIFIDKFVAGHLLKHDLPKGYQNKVKVLGSPLGSRRLYLALSQSPESNTLMRDFNRGLAKIRRNGTYTYIMDRDGLFAGKRLVA